MFRHLLGITRQGALVLLMVCILSGSALAGTKNAPMATNFSAYTSGSSTLITIYGTAPMAYSVSRPDARTIMVSLPGVDASRLADSYVVISPLVSGVIVERELRGADNIWTRMKVALRAPARDRSELARNNLVLELTPLVSTDETSSTKNSAVAGDEAPQQNPQTKPTPTPRPSVSLASGQDRQQSQGEQYGKPGFVGEPINLNVVNADIRDILNYITEQYGVNFVIDSSVGAIPVTINVTDVPWNVALDAILKANRLGADANGNILRVATVEVLAGEAASQQKITEARLDNSPLITEFIRLNYARASGTLAQAAGSTGGFAGGATNLSFSGGAGGDATGGGGDQGLLPIIQRRLSRRGAIEVDGRSNTLIVTDVRENIEAIRQLVAILDQPEPQVEIETRIVIATRNFSRDLGVQLSAAVVNLGRGGVGSLSTLPSGGTAPAAGTSPVPRSFGIPGGLAGAAQPNGTLGATANTVIGLTTGIFGTAQISALITAGETKGQAKTVATPRVTALNNRPAQIESGTQIPVQTTGALGVVTTTFVSVPLRLSITPQITDAGTVVLRVTLENNTVNTGIAVGGVPGINTQRMQSEVLVPDGGTTVMGGVLLDSEGETQQRTPGLASIPVLGNLFKRKLVTRGTDEILFFITPRIYRPDYQGKPISGTIANGTRTTTIMQPVTPGNPSTNTPTPTNLEQQQAVPQTNPGGPSQPITSSPIQNPAGAPTGNSARPTSLSTRP
ncbi:MAG: type pilus assembly protein PilQ [Acidobacteriota bacterium]|jgi:type IV pilus assembly protein PilQ|nr:type pilus assembly protein PilQ [Acidobacteriota bacterium]